MRKKSLLDKVKFYLRIRWRAFKRRPLIFLRYMFNILFFRLLGIIICLFLTVIPLPLNHLVQNMFNLNLSFNSFREIVSSVQKIALNFNHLMPSPNDILRVINTVITNVNPYNLINIIRDIPTDLRQFILRFLDYLRERFKDLRLFIKSLWPPKNIWFKFKIFIKTHALILRRIKKNIFMMIGSLILVKLLFLMIIPFLGIGAIYFLDVNISLVIIAILSLISSQLGSLIGRLIDNALVKLYDRLERRQTTRTMSKFMSLLLICIAEVYRNIRFLFLVTNVLICQSINLYIQKIKKAKITLFVIYIYYKSYLKDKSLKK